jgi:apolipoprotein N-acyltransferase
MIKNFLLALTSGLLFALSWPTYGLSLFLFVAFVPLLLSEWNLRKAHEKHVRKKVFFNAYCTFFIFNLSTTWWLYYATPFGMWFAVLTNSILMSSVFFMYHLIAQKTDFKTSIICLVTLWIGFEKMHLNWELSWPWLNLGNGFSDSYKWIQWYEYTGVFGGTLWIWIVNILLFRAVVLFQKNSHKIRFVRQLILAGSVVVLGVFYSLYIYHTSSESTTKTGVLVLQPNLDPYTEKYEHSNQKMAEELVSMATQKIDSAVSFVIAPETTLPRPRLISTFENTPEYKTIQNFVDTHRISFLSGITFYNQYSAHEPPNKTANFYKNSKQWYNSFNSSFFTTPGRSFETYHKSKLVVGVEHTPYRSFLNPLLGSFMIDLGGLVSTLSTQKERAVFTNGNESVGPIICYESVYGAYVTEYVQKGASFLAIITNDGWWNNSQGHKQHLSLARLRAIENRRAIARSANTGVSAFINSKGDVIQSLEYNQKGSIQTTLPTNTKITYYTKHGDYIYRIAMLTLVLVLLGTFTKKRKRSSK